VYRWEEGVEGNRVEKEGVRAKREKEKREGRMKVKITKRSKIRKVARLLPIKEVSAFCCSTSEENEWGLVPGKRDKFLPGAH
jgi:hypothetical protein